jgi:hypothetical protein
MLFFSAPHGAPEPQAFIARYSLPAIMGWSGKDILPLKVSLFVSSTLIEDYMPLEDFMKWEHFRYRLFFRGKRYLGCWPGKGDFNNDRDRKKPRGGYFIELPWAQSPLAKCVDFGPDWPEYLR